MRREVRPYEPRYWYIVAALPMAAGAIVFLVRYLISDERGDLFVFSYALFLTVFVGAFAAWAVWESRSTRWVFTDDRFTEVSRMRKFDIQWADVRRFHFDQRRLSIPGLGLPRDLALEGDVRQARDRLSVVALREAQLQCGAIDEFFRRLRPETVDPRLVVLKHVIDHAPQLALRHRETVPLARAFDQAGRLRLVSACRQLSAAERTGALDAEGVVLLAEARFLMRQPAAATDLCDQVLEKRLNDYWALLCKALALWELCRTDEAGTILSDLAKRESPYTPIIKAFHEKQMAGGSS